MRSARPATANISGVSRTRRADVVVEFPRGEGAVMSVRDRDYYLRLRREYEPENIKLIIVGESPPASGKYFYDRTGSAKEPLFAAIMLQLGLSPGTKEIG